ncbi:Uncharacterised protein [Corynebacterium kutscheri]|nr:Uncharacterised protein [Corynebacterium kutscheri]
MVTNIYSVVGFKFNAGQRTHAKRNKNIALR